MKQNPQPKQPQAIDSRPKACGVWARTWKANRRLTPPQVRESWQWLPRDPQPGRAGRRKGAIGQIEKAGNKSPRAPEWPERPLSRRSEFPAYRVVAISAPQRKSRAFKAPCSRPTPGNGARPPPLAVLWPAIVGIPGTKAAGRGAQGAPSCILRRCTLGPTEIGRPCASFC